MARNDINEDGISYVLIYTINVRKSLAFHVFEL